MEDFLHSFVGKECYKEMVLNGNLFYGPCISLVISKLLGYLIIAGSLILKVPQILKIVGAKSAEGISLSSVILELFGFLISCAYSFRKGFPFGTYGESAFIIVQNLIIIYLIFFYGQGVNIQFFAITFGYLAALYVFIFNPMNVIDMGLLTTLQGSIVLIVLASRIPQIWTNFSAKSAGQLAFLTWFLNFAGTAARVFTTIQQTQDQVILFSFLVSLVLNGIIVFQILFYGNAKTKTGKKD